MPFTVEICIKNIPYEADAEDLTNHLTAVTGCAVGQVRLINRSDTGRPRGFGFAHVLLDSEDQVDDLVRKVFGSKMTVDKVTRSLECERAIPRTLQQRMRYGGGAADPAGSDA